MSDSLGTSSIFSKCKAPKKLAFIHTKVTLSIFFETNKIKGVSIFALDYTLIILNENLNFLNILNLESFPKNDTNL
jgi:hypothetical protein